jgi:cytochrome c peroxidase
MKKIILYSLLGIFIVGRWTGCKTDTPPPETKSPATPITLDAPKYFPFLTIPQQNPMTKEGLELGRRLYYDPLLSTNGPLQGMACASCHLQSKSFSNNAPGTSVISHINMGWRENFLWKGGIEGSLEEAMLFEVQDFFQVDMNVLQNDALYPSLFEKAFGTDVITPVNTSFALAQFFRSMISSNSKYDKFLRREVALTHSERMGLTIFESEKGDCFHCHSLPLSIDNSFHNTGLDSVFTGDNQGRYMETLDSNDLGKFMTPSLRNVALTAPYMHDGRFQTLRAVVEHYNSKVVQNDQLDPIMTKNGRLGLQLSSEEVDHLIEFLHTLTDTSYLSNPKLASPF